MFYLKQLHQDVFSIWTCIWVARLHFPGYLHAINLMLGKYLGTISLAQSSQITCIYSALLNTDSLKTIEEIKTMMIKN